MNQRDQVLAKLAKALSGIYLDLERARGLAKEVGLDLAVIEQDRTSLNYWGKILKEAEHQRAVEDILETAVREYPKEASLLKARDEYLAWAAAGRPEASPQTGGGDRSRPQVLFDESHGQDLWWYLPPTVDQGFHRLKEIAAKHFRVEFLGGEGKTTAAQLADVAAFILAIGPQGKTRLEPDEIDAIQDFVKKGGGLFVIGTYTGDWHHEANLNRLIEYFGIAFNRDVVLPAGAGPDDCKDQSPQYLPKAKSVVAARPVQAVPSSNAKRTWSALTRNVDEVLTLSSCSLYVEDSKAVPLLESEPTSLVQEPVPVGITIRIEKCQARGSGPVTLMAASRFSKVVVSGNYKMFLNDFIDYPGSQNRKFWENILKWLTA